MISDVSEFNVGKDRDSPLKVRALHYDLQLENEGVCTFREYPDLPHRYRRLIVPRDRILPENSARQSFTARVYQYCK